MRLVSLSDTHGRHREVRVPSGDVLIHAGDFTHDHTDIRELIDFNDWLGSQPHPIKLVGPGNHDVFFQSALGLAKSMLTNARVLIDEAIEVGGQVFYFSPWTPMFCNWAFMLDRGSAEMRRVWERAKLARPDVLVTHGPAYKILDRILIAPTPKDGEEPYLVPSPHFGCADFRRALPEIAPKINIFGHVHTSHGRMVADNTEFYNVSIVDEDYRVRYPATIIDIDI